MMPKLTIDYPPPLLEEARKAAQMTKQSLESYVLQATLERIQRQNRDSDAKQPAPRPRRSWSKEQFVRNRVWIEDNIQTLEQNYPDQWVIVHEQKVVGADRKMGDAQDKAAQVIGNIFKAGSMMHFVEVSRRVY